MSMPFDTLRLARRLEAAGFAPRQAGDMAEAIAEAVAQLATKSDLAPLEMRIDNTLEILIRDMTIRLGGMMVVSVGVILAGFKLIH